MTERERDETFKAMMDAATNIIGFHALGEAEDIAKRPVDRLVYDAYVYASAIELARLVHAFNRGLGEE